MSEPKLDSLESKLAVAEFDVRNLRIELNLALKRELKAIHERDEARAEVERLRGILPELPPRAPDGGGLPRYGLYWRRPTDPLSVPMESGYWTPWHLAKEALRLVVERQRQAMIAAINDDSYANYNGAEVVGILKAVPLVTEVKDV